MIYRFTPHFVIKQNLQKSSVTGVYFTDLISNDILTEICSYITGQKNFTSEYVDNSYEDNVLQASYNKGRLVVLYYQDYIHIISFSEKEVNGRNSSVQSVPTAFNIFYNLNYEKKRLYYYFLNTTSRVQTDYQLFIYRLMKTVGFVFLNNDELQVKLHPFSSIDDLIRNRKANASKNKSNNSSYITKSSYNNIDIYGKVYGANKYETSLLCYALNKLKDKRQIIRLFEISEQNLCELPKSSLDVLKKMDSIQVIPSGLQLERQVFEKNNSLRSPRYIYNLLKRIGKKYCAFCGCEIPEIIQGAHIWPVFNIKRESNMPIDEKIFHATNGHNGIWLCENHHKLFDANILRIENNGHVYFDKNLDKRYSSFINKTTIYRQLSNNILSDEFLKYLRLRNRII